MSGRTFSRYDWMAARQAWDDGDFSSEWAPFRALAADRGMIYPPTGTALDAWNAEEPAQRALIIRAIRDTPTLLRQSILSSRSWGEVVTKLIRQRDEWKELDDLEQTYVRRERRSEEPTEHGSAMSIASLLERVAASRGIVETCPNCGFHLRAEPVREAM